MQAVAGLDLAAAYTVTDVEITESNDGTKGNASAGKAQHRTSL